MKRRKKRKKKRYGLGTAMDLTMAGMKINFALGASGAVKAAI